MKNLNILETGSTRSGKTLAEIRRLLTAASLGAAVVVCDPHRDSLAAGLFSHLIARSFARPLVYDQLATIDRVPGYAFLMPPSFSHRSPLEGLAEADELIRAFADVLIRRRGMQSLATASLTEEWLIPALQLLVFQPHGDRPSLILLNHAFDADHPAFRRLLSRCTNPEVAARFLEIERGNVSPGQYAPAQRLLRGTLTSPTFAARSGDFELGPFLDEGGILLVEGGGAVSYEAQASLFGGIILQVLHYVRTRSRPSPPVILALDEANNAKLISESGYEVRAAAELQKNNLGIHILVQTLNFPSVEITEGVLANCLRHEWYFQANESVIRKAAADLGGKQYGDLVRQLKPGERLVKEYGRIFKEYVPLLPDPFGFPGLAKAKAADALASLKKRAPYRTPQLASVAVSGETADPWRSRPSRPVPPPDETDNPNLGV